MNDLSSSRPTLDLNPVFDLARRVCERFPVLRRVNYQLAPPHHAGSVLENQLGYQVVRAIGRNAQYWLRPEIRHPDVDADLAELSRDGVIVRPNFLPPEVFAQVLDEYEAATPELERRLEPIKNSPRARLHGFELDASKLTDRFPVTTARLQRNEWLVHLAESVLKRPVENWPELRIQHYRIADEEAPEADLETVLHADHHFPTLKAFLYLDDVDESNGAFVYAPRTHRLTLARLRHEYDMSTRSARHQAWGPTAVPPELLVRKAEGIRDIIDPRRHEALGIRETPICGRANTLVVANTMGFHRRGEFQSGTGRRTILVNFRYLESRRPDTYGGPRRSTS